MVSTLTSTTGRRCAFCDGPIGSESKKTIEHFQPKKTFPELAYVWSNLFPCCTVCQDFKRANYSQSLIKPDLADYSFYNYFEVNYSTGEILPSLDATPENQARAKYTIESYGLNDPDRLENRKRELRHYLDANATDPEDYNYRWFLR